MSDYVSGEIFQRVIQTARETGEIHFEFKRLSDELQEFLVEIIRHEGRLFRYYGFEGSGLGADNVLAIAEIVSTFHNIEFFDIRGCDFDTRVYFHFGVMCSHSATGKRIVQLDDQNIRKQLSKITADHAPSRPNNATHDAAPKNSASGENNDAQADDSPERAEMKKLVEKELPRFARESLAMLDSNLREGVPPEVRRVFDKVERAHVLAKNDLCSLSENGYALAQPLQKAYALLFFRFHNFVQSTSSFAPMFMEDVINDGNIGLWEEVLLYCLRGLGAAGSLAETVMLGMSFGASAFAFSFAHDKAKERIYRARGNAVFKGLNKCERLFVNGHLADAEEEKAYSRFVVGANVAAGNLIHLMKNKENIRRIIASEGSQHIDQMAHDYCSHMFHAMTFSQYAVTATSGRYERHKTPYSGITSKTKYSEHVLARVFFMAEQPQSAAKRAEKSLFEKEALNVNHQAAKLYCGQYRGMVNTHLRDLQKE